MKQITGYIESNTKNRQRNEKQYNYSKDCASRFAYSIAIVKKDEAWRQRDSEGWQMDIDVKQSHLMALQEEISEYERLSNCDKKQRIEIQVESFNKLPDVLIKARIAAKISQKELAEILGIKEERIQEFEKTDYQCASFLEVLNVSEALGVEFKNAFVEVDFEEIEEFKKVAAQFHERQQKNKSIKAKAS